MDVMGQMRFLESGLAPGLPGPPYRPGKRVLPQLTAPQLIKLIGKLYRRITTAS